MTKLSLTMRVSIKLLLAAIPALTVAREFEAFSLASLNHTEVQPIVGGTEIVPGSRPYLVALEPVGCGGSLISPRAVLTAAHCLFDEGDWNPPQVVIFNRHNTDEPAEEVAINLANTEVGGDVVPHPRYNPNGNDDLDVAILFLPNAMNEIMPITLNLDPNIPAARGDPLEVTGWGLTSTDGDSSNVPLSVDLDYIPREACTERPFQWSPGQITDNMLCAFGDQKDSCGGDSGGPLVLGSPQGGPLEPFVQVGIVSFGADPEDTGEGCASSIYPGVYTRVSSVANWVRSTVCDRVGELCTIASKAGKAKTRKD